MRSNSSLKLNNVQVEEQKKSLAPHGSMTTFSGSKKNGVMQLKSEKLCESVCTKKDQRLDGRIKLLGETLNKYVEEKWRV